jgi:hypothetical protein
MYINLIMAFCKAGFVNGQYSQENWKQAAIISKCHVTSNKAKSNLECAEDKFQTRGCVRGCEKWKNEC